MVVIARRERRSGGERDEGGETSVAREERGRKVRQGEHVGKGYPRRPATEVEGPTLSPRPSPRPSPSPLVRNARLIDAARAEAGRESKTGRQGRQARQALPRLPDENASSLRCPSEGEPRPLTIHNRGASNTPTTHVVPGLDAEGRAVGVASDQAQRYLLVGPASEAGGERR